MVLIPSDKTHKPFLELCKVSKVVFKLLHLNYAIMQYTIM